MSDKSKIILIIALVLLVGALTGGFWYGTVLSWRQAAATDSQLALLQKEVSVLSRKLAGQATTTQSQLSALRQQAAASAQQPAPKSQNQLLTEAVAKVAPSVVSIIISQDVPQYQVVYENPFGNDPGMPDPGIRIPVYQPTGQSQSQEVGAGTGFLITSDGYILTNRHVVPDDQDSYTVLLSSGKQEAASVVYRDPNNDLAIIKISGSGFKPAVLGDSASLQLGETVFAVGNALGQYNNSVSVGVISGQNRSITANDAADGSSEQLTGVIQTDAAINPGNSGGPLADLNGDVVGINVATVQGSNNISFSIPISQVRQIVKAVLGK